MIGRALVSKKLFASCSFSALSYFIGYNSYVCLSSTSTHTTASSLISSFATSTASFLDIPEFNSQSNKESSDTTSTNSLIVINEEECRDLFPMSSAIEVQGKAFQSAFNNLTIIPSRLILAMPSMPANNDTLFKPAVITNTILGQKIVSVRPENPSKYNLPSITGCILLFDIETGLTKCVMNAEFITGRRTAAGSGYATHLLAKLNAKQLVVFGSGVQAEEHIRAMLSVRGQTIESIFLINRNIEKAVELKNKIESVSENSHLSFVIKVIELQDFQENQCEKYGHVITDADIICTCTASSEPLFDGRLLLENRNGVHINCVGSFKASMREIDEHVIRRCDAIFVDSEHAFECGDLFHIENNQELNWMMIGEYGLLMDKSDDILKSKITLFESVGTASQDLHSAYFIYEHALRKKFGTIVELG